RRHGIINGYNGGNRTKLIISGNHCVQTRWTGIYTQGNNEVMGTNILTGNFCIDNGWQQGEPLSGGIFSAVEVVGDIIPTNFVLGYRNAGFNSGVTGAIKL